MRWPTGVCILFAVICMGGFADEFYLRHDETGQHYGPFQLEDGARIKIQETVYTLVKDATSFTTVKEKGKQEWEKIASFGAITTVYMSPAGLSDKHYIAQVLHTLRSRQPVQQIWFFDKKSRTPTGLPMADQQMFHWRAKYGVNRNTGYEEFVFIKITNPTTSPPELREEKVNIRPGYAE